MVCKEFVCPYCGETFRFCDESIVDFKDIEGCTCDCPGCGRVLLVKDGKFVELVFDGFIEIPIESEEL